MASSIENLFEKINIQERGQWIVKYLRNKNIFKSNYHICSFFLKMNQIINKFLLAGDKFMPEIYLRQPGFTYSACGSFTKNEDKFQKFRQTEDISKISKIYIKTNQVKLLFNMICLMEILRTYLEDQLLTKYYTIKRLIYLKIQNMMDITEAQVQCSIFDKKTCNPNKGTGIGSVQFLRTSLLQLRDN